MADQRYLKLSPEYLHYNELIWKVPSISITLGSGVVIAVFAIADTGCSNGNCPDLNVIQSGLLLFGTLLMFALTSTVFGYRIYQSAAAPSDVARLEPPFRSSLFPGLGSNMLLQSVMCLATGFLAGVTLYAFTKWKNPETIIVGVAFGIFLIVFCEGRFCKLFDELKARRGDVDASST